MAADKKDATDQIIEAQREASGTIRVLRDALAAAPSATEVLARPMVYEAWLKKAQKALNG